MTKGAEFSFEQQARLFREKFGREMGPHDPVLFDPHADEPRRMSMTDDQTELYDALGIEDHRPDREAIAEEHGLVHRYGRKPERNDRAPAAQA